MVFKVTKTQSITPNMIPKSVEFPSMQFETTNSSDENSSSDYELERDFSVKNISATAGASNEINSRSVYVRELKKGKKEEYVLPRQNIFAIPNFDDANLQKVLPNKKEGESIADMKTEDAGSTEQQDRRNSVRFSSATIQLYPITLGDNPGGKGGPPLTIGWESFSSISVDIDLYEASRNGKRRNHNEMQIPRDQRLKMLLGLEYTMFQINNSTKSANIVRRRRSITTEGLQYSRLHEMMETATRKTRMVLTLGKEERREKKYLERWYTSPKKGGEKKYRWSIS